MDRSRSNQRRTTGRPQPVHRKTKAADRRRNTRRTVKRRMHLTIEDPKRFAIALGILCILLLLGCVLLISKDGKEPEESGVQTVMPDTGDGLGNQIPAASGQITQPDGIRNQLMGFFGSLIISNSENYPHDPIIPEEEMLQQIVKPDYKYCVVLDASHGGEDAGYTYEDVMENPIMLDIVMELRSAIQTLDPAIEVILTRESDTYMDYSERVKIANEAQAHLFITIHCDMYSEDTSVSGISCQYWNEEEMTERDQRSKDAAEKLAADLSGALGLTNYGAWNAVMEVLYETEMPSVALQYGYLSNENDRWMLQDEALRAQGVDALAQSIVEIVNSY